MAQFTITISPIDNDPPNQIGDNTIQVDYAGTHIFNWVEFTLATNPPFQDPEGDAPLNVKIITLPLYGVLTYNGVNVTINQEIPLPDLINIDFIYTADSGTVTSYDDPFTFTISDVGSQQYYNGFATMTMDVFAKDNEPPVIGDGEATIEYARTLVFTRAMFTTQTTPPYSDPEGDAALNLRIDSLPVLGTIIYNGLNVLPNQIISFSDIDAGLLIYEPDLNDVDGDIQGFTFSISDAGSNTFVS